jgi:hypothetical protein
VKEVDHSLPLYEFKLNPSFKLYTRSICKDSITNFPINCDSRSGGRVETGYIVLSKESKQVLVINNIPNRNQKFFDEGRVRREEVSIDTVFMNAFFFKQFRFGTLLGDGETPPMKFESAEKNPRIFRWDYKLDDDTLKIIAVANILPDGEDVRTTESSLYLVPAFLHSNNFKFTFQLPTNITKGVTRNTSEAKIFIHQKSKKNFVTYIEFATPIYKDNRAIRFAANRMYAFSMSNEQ